MNSVPRYREHLDAAVTIDVMDGHFMEAWHPNWPEKILHLLDGRRPQNNPLDLLFFKIKIWWIKLDRTPEDSDCALVILVTEGLIFGETLKMVF